MSSSELAEWIAFDREYGLPDAFFAVAQLTAAVLAPYAKKTPEPGDFVPFFREPKKPQTVADHKAMFRRIARQRI
jgi:hypothetical protein